MIYIFIVHPAYKVYFALLLYRSSTIAIIRTYRFTKCLSRLYCKTSWKQFKTKFSHKCI